jgi:hypothetical protein
MLALALVGAACGSTVSQAERRAAQTSAGVDQGDVNVSAGGTSDTAASGQGGAAVGGATAAGRTGGGGTASRATGLVGSTSTSATGIVMTGPGVDAKTIHIGIPYATDTQAANAALGAGGISQGDPHAQAKVVIDDINAHGGIAGRKIEPVWHEVSSTSPETADQLEQEECDDFTKDHKVFVFMEGSGTRDLIRDCAEKNGAMIVSDPLSTSDQSTFSRFPHYIEITGFRLDRMSRFLPDVLKGQGYFSGWNAVTGSAAPTKAKVGIMTYDYPTFVGAVSKVLVPKLAQLGYPVAAEDVRTVTWLNSNSDAGALAAGVSAAVLKFRQDQVTHVLIIDERGLLTLLFVNQAQSQRYFPRYGWNTQNGPQALKDGANFPSQQLIGSKGMGWLPGLDMSAADDPPNGPYSNETRRKCNELYKAHGITFPDRNAESGALGTCSTFWFLRDSFNAVGSPITRDTYVASLNKFGHGFQSPGLFDTFFSANQHDGVGAVRQYAYVESCDCMRYTSGNISVSVP